MVSALGLGNPNAATGPKTICHKIGEILTEPRRKVRLGDTLRDVLWVADRGSPVTQAQHCETSHP